MIEWYKDKDLAIFFDKRPSVSVRYALPSMSMADKNAVAKYPFENKLSLKVVLFNHQKQKKYEFVIPKGYCWDGATIPRLFWRLIGSKTDSRFLIPSMIHDVLCENHEYVGFDRYFSTCVFERLLYISGVSAFNRWLIFHSVDNFQKFCNWEDTKPSATSESKVG